MRDERAELAALYREFYRCKLAADTAGLDAILAPDFTLTHMTGFRQSKADWLAEVASGQMRYLSAEEERLDIERDGDRASIVGRSRVGARIHGAKGVWNLQLTMRAARSGGKWIIEDIVAAPY